ncbi:hypothetical protein CHRYSEOSP005_27380 [Chryseobacterium sp. Alg-005]|uniref:porin family protein n=1 Tax=Chryseobacterium sp. Alg-005 TaxID=3159516 RepID=UPI0035558B07
MRKILLIVSATFAGLSYAQITKGSVYIGGQIGYSQKENKNTHAKEENINILPVAGFFVSNNLAAGAGVGYVNRKSKTVTPFYSPSASGIVISETRRSALVINPFVRKYWSLSDKLYFFGELEIPMEFGKVETEESASNISNPVSGAHPINLPLSDEANYTSAGVNIKPGLDYFLNKNWTIEASIGEFGYSTSKLDVDGAKSVANSKFGLDLSAVTISVKYVFNK